MCFAINETQADVIWFSEKAVIYADEVRISLCEAHRYILEVYNGHKSNDG